MINRGIKSHFKGEIYTPVHRTCRKCGIKKSLGQFVKVKECVYGRSHTCKECNKMIRAPRYKRDRKKRAQRENYLNRKRKLILVEWFGDKCKDCNESFPPCVYDFHHTDPSHKDFKISNYRKRPGNLLEDEDLREELSKCVMLCSNCHRIRHWYESDRTEERAGLG